MMIFDIILPTLWRPTLINAIRSILEQTYPQWHLYVVADGFSLPADFRNYFNDARISFHSISPRAHDSGATPRNIGIGFGTNPWITYIDDDDIWLPHHLETFKEHIILNPEINMLHSAGRMVTWSPHKKSLKNKGEYFQPLTVGMCHTRPLFNKTIGWSTVYTEDHDIRLWHEMLENGGNCLAIKQVTFRFLRGGKN